ncbi:hypothetical protein [Sphingobium sp. TKS]|nr:MULTISPECIES: hypothetical protein [Sphingomonadaceae]
MLFIAALLTFPVAWALSTNAVPRQAGLPIALGGTLLMFDWAFGIRMLPRLLSPTQIGNERQVAERIMYSFPFALPRYSSVLFLIVGGWMGIWVFGEGDWLGFVFIIAIIFYAIAMFKQSLKAIELAVQQVLREVR